MTRKQKQPRKPWRLKTAPKIKPLDPDVPLAPYRAPAPPRGKFEHVPGQQMIDFDK